MRRRLVAANWKMNGSGGFANDFAAALVPALEGLDAGVEVVVAPPSILVPAVRDALREHQGRRISIGVQNVSEWDCGAYTGEIAASMAVDQQCSFAIIGHSERRSLFSEDDASINRKLHQALSAGLEPILCVGETLAEREAGEALAVVERQVAQALAGMEAGDWRHLCIAYEPVWAIGTGRTASAEDAQQVHGHIRQWLERQGGSAADVPIIYGGSVKPESAADLFAQPDIDGGLIGGASLKPADFAAICRAA